MLRIYLAASWRRKDVVIEVYNVLKSRGFEVDCFCNESQRTCFNIRDELEKAGHSANEVDPISALKHPAVEKQFKLAFTEDKKWLDWSNCVIMLMPCGNSAHLEAGYAKGQGKKLFILWLFPPEPGTFDNMYQFADGLYTIDQFKELLSTLRGLNEVIE